MLIASFSGPRMETPRVLWPTLRYLQGDETRKTMSFTRPPSWITVLMADIKSTSTAKKYMWHQNKIKGSFTCRPRPPGFYEWQRRDFLCDSASSRLWFHWGNDPSLQHTNKYNPYCLAELSNIGCGLKSPTLQLMSLSLTFVRGGHGGVHSGEDGQLGFVDVLLAERPRLGPVHSFTERRQRLHWVGVPERHTRHKGQYTMYTHYTQ